MGYSLGCRWSAFILLAICAVTPARALDEPPAASDAAVTGEANGSSSPPPGTTNSTISVSPMAFTNAAGLPPLPKDVAPIASPPKPSSHVATLVDADLREYAMQTPAVQSLIDRALSLTTLNLTYKYGSSDPKQGGMDCSGTVYFLLKDIGIRDVPRDASGMYKWVWTRSRFQAVVSPNPDTFELAALKPGDLLFWTGTYAVDHDPPVTHVMIYLGINRHTGHRVMVGASEGRRFNGQSQYGVSVFDFTLPGKRPQPLTAPGTAPAEERQARFIGYGTVPDLDQSGSATASKM